MKILPYIIIFFIYGSISAQKPQEINIYKNYIINYYSNFTTGYNFDGKYVTISENYNASFSEAIFTLTFVTFDEYKNSQNQIVSFNIKEAMSIEPHGTDVVEIHDSETLILPISGKLAFNEKSEIFVIPIYYEVDEDVITTNIYKAFEAVKEFYGYY